VELSEKPGSFSSLVGRRVENSSGRKLGHVYEARAHWERDGSVVIDELMVGRRALRRRLRGPGVDARGIPWESVVELGPDRVVVHHQPRRN
jgi:sporulation protein YlmC with PRC-barrel domain